MLHEVNSFPKRVEISLSPGPNHRHVFPTKALMRRCNSYNHNLEWSRRGEAAPLGVGWRWRRDPDEGRCQRMEMKRSVVGWKVPEGTETVSFARSSFIMLAHEAFELPFRAGSERPLVPKFPFWDATPRPQPVARWPALGPPSSARALRVNDCAGTPRLAVAKNVQYVYKRLPPTTNIVPDRSSTPSTNSRRLITDPHLESEIPRRSHTGPSFLYFRLGSSSSICRCPPA